jgi:hypothetical protein
MKIKMENFGRTARFAIAFVLYVVLILVVMGLWNLLVPGITHWSSINFWQALGLTVLCRLLCGSMHHFGCLFGYRHRHHHHGRLHDMSPEEREAFVRRRFQNLVKDEKGEDE